jgi:hypothetical protein
MPAINKRYVKKSRKDFYCDDCHKLIEKGSSYLYLYGMAEINEKPYSLRFCLACDNEFKESIEGKAND